jgi:secreted PhoX family phosphatase
VSGIDRRAFLRAALRYGGAAAVAPSLAGLVACGTRGVPSGLGGTGSYGPLAPSADCPELALPDEFRCARLSVAGDLMSDGSATPNAFDGMAAFALPGGTIRLIRNHENRDTAAVARPFGDAAMAYDQRAGGGTTSLEVRVAPDGSRQLVRHFASLTGTHVNCAGGPTPWGSWLSCEETTEGPTQGRDAAHGYVFEVPVSAEDEVMPVPITAMGRMVHEAVAVDPVTGVVYLTEDRRYVAGDPTAPGAGLYRYLPDQPGTLLAGGRLQQLAITGQPGYDTSRGQSAGVALPVTWVDVAEPDPPAAESDPSAVFRAGLVLGAAIFQRLEGCWYGDGGIYFNATSGGDAGAGQVWRYREGELLLVFESPSPSVLDGPDNLVVSPRGGIVLCEDGSGTQFLRGLSPTGTIFDFAQNLINDAEFAGACFSPDGGTFFVNIQGSTVSTGTVPGMTFAIWGPWGRGAL